MQVDIAKCVGKRYFNRNSLLRFLQSARFKSTDTSQWSSKKVRQLFLDFFCKDNGHQFVRSSSVIPPKDLGTYFTNAGMNQFKPLFLGTVPHGSEMLDYKRVANSQKCVRVGGKHNDLEDVGADLTHHTFFEMLGSWSFGDYFKDEACRQALTLLLEGYKLPLNRLYFTYFAGNPALGLEPDLQCKGIWERLGVPPAHILPFGAGDNFWDMGDTGPCGPCTEIHYDHVGGRDAAHIVNKGSPEVVEIWNLVFMQFDRLSPRQLVPLPNTHVDTGMGLERMCAVMQGTRSNYNTDLFHPIFHLIHKSARVPIYKDTTGSSNSAHLDRAYRIIADHTRMATVCISDGLLPGRLDLEHKLRSVIHRALYQCQEVMSAPRGMMALLVQPVVDSLGDVYPEISTNSLKVKDVLLQTEDRYLELHERGRKNFEKLLKKNPELSTIHGETLKQLHEGYYGSPMSLEMIHLLAPAYKLTVNQSDVVAILEQEKSISVTADVNQGSILSPEVLHTLSQTGIPVTQDQYKYQYQASQSGYRFPILNSTMLCILDEGNHLVEKAEVGSRVGIIVDKTPFYAEKGGQVGDKGILKTETGSVEISDTQSSQGYAVHVGTVTSGFVGTSQTVSMEIDQVHRVGCMKHHTATHLLNAALRKVLGPDVTQRGSCVLPHKLTFDFSCMCSVTNEDLERIEKHVNTTIENNLMVDRQLQPLKAAQSIDGVIFLHDVIYPSDVFVISVEGENEAVKSVEFCGGTHVQHTGDLDYICITNLTGVSSGTKSLTAITGHAARQACESANQLQKLCLDLEREMKASQPDLDKVIYLQKQINQGLGTETLPKVAKDDMMTQMEELGTDISAALNKQAFIQLQQDLKEKMTHNDAYVVHQFTMKTLLKLNKIMLQWKATKPLMLVVETSNNTVAYILLPKAHGEVMDEIVKDFCKCVNAKVTKQESNFQLTSRKGNHTQLFVDSARQVLEKYFCTDSKSTEIS